MNRWNDNRIKKTKRPSFKHCFGRTWDSITIILPNEEKVEGRVDTTWGRWAYFIDRVSGDWYKVSMENCVGRYGLKIDLTKEN